MYYLNGGMEYGSIFTGTTMEDGVSREYGGWSQSVATTTDYD